MAPPTDLDAEDISNRQQSLAEEDVRLNEDKSQISTSNESEDSGSGTSSSSSTSASSSSGADAVAAEQARVLTFD